MKQNCVEAWYESINRTSWSYCNKGHIIPLEHELNPDYQTWEANWICRLLLNPPQNDENAKEVYEKYGICEDCLNTPEFQMLLLKKQL